MPQTPTVLGAQDRTILEALQRDSRLTNAEVAARAGMSASACWRRTRALEVAGVITGYGARVDPRACGMTFHAIVHVHLSRHLPEIVGRFIAAVRHRDEVQDCFATTGDSDYLLRVLCADQTAYNAFLEQFLFHVDGVAQVRTSLILKEIKQSRGYDAQ